MDEKQKNGNKYKGMWYYVYTNQKLKEIHYNGEKIERTQEYTYLGIRMN